MDDGVGRWPGAEWDQTVEILVKNLGLMGAIYPEAPRTAALYSKEFRLEHREITVLLENILNYLEEWES